MQKEFAYSYQGKDYLVRVTYKRSHTISMRYKDDAIVVNAPYLTSKQTIFKYIDKWSKRLLAENAHNIGIGENYIYILGDKYLIDESGTIALNNGMSFIYKDKEDLQKKLNKYLLEIITSRARYYESLMNTYPSEIKVRNMVSRYGSNKYVTHRISFSTVLLHYSLDVIDAIVVHELAHNFVHNHSKNFYNIVYQYCPNYKILNQRLKKGEFHD